MVIYLPGFDWQNDRTFQVEEKIRSTSSVNPGNCDNFARGKQDIIVTEGGGQKFLHYTFVCGMCSCKPTVICSRWKFLQSNYN